MDFDQMMDAWKAQDEAPLYGVNRELLQLVLTHEQAGIRRGLRRDQWMTYIFGPGMALFGAFWMWVAIVQGLPALDTLAAGIGAGMFVLWVFTYWLSRRRQSRRERSFGSTLQDEIRRSLSLVEYQLSNAGRLGAAFLWSAPPVIGATLIYWLTTRINTDNGLSAWDHAVFLAALFGLGVCTTYRMSRAAKRKLEPRRQRLRELLATLDAGE